MYQQASVSARQCVGTPQRVTERRSVANSLLTLFLTQGPVRVRTAHGRASGTTRDSWALDLWLQQMASIVGFTAGFAGVG